MTKIVAALLFAILAISSRGELLRDCFSVVPGYIPHLISTEQGITNSIDFAVETNALGVIKVTVHHTRGCGYVEAAKAGDVITDNLFIRDRHEIEGTGTVFCVAFMWWYPGSGPATVKRYGWFELSTADGKLTVTQSEMSDRQKEAQVSGESPQPPDDPSEEDTESDKWEWVALPDGIRITKRIAALDESGVLVVPAMIKGFPVVEIGDEAFRYEESLTSMALPETIRGIGNGAFEACICLTNCNIPASVTNIGYSAFADCMALKSVALPAGLQLIRESTFRYCVSLASVSFAGDTVVIENGAFNDCTSLLSIDLPFGFVVGDLAFPDTCMRTCRYPWESVREPVVWTNDMTEVDESTWRVVEYTDHVELDACCISAGPERTDWRVAIPERIQGKPVTGIGDDAFSDGCKISVLVIPNTVSNIGAKALSGNERIQTLVVPDSVTNMDYASCSDMCALQELVVGSGLLTCGEEVFAYCRSLTNVVLREGCSIISRRMFSGCDALERVTIPPSVKRIQCDAFSGCTSLAEVMVPLTVEIEDGAFPSGCKIMRVGPVISCLGDEVYAQDPQFARLLRCVDSLQRNKAWAVNFCLEGCAEIGKWDTRGNLDTLSYAGLSASRYEMQNDGTLNAFFSLPTFKTVGFDLAQGRMSVLVEPGNGSSRINRFESENIAYIFASQTLEGLVKETDFYGYAPGHDPVRVDESEYMSKGVLHYDISDIVQENRFFRFNVKLYYGASD